MRDLPEILKVERYRGKDAVYDSTGHVKHFHLEMVSLLTQDNADRFFIC